MYLNFCQAFSHPIHLRWIMRIMIPVSGWLVILWKAPFSRIEKWCRGRLDQIPLLRKFRYPAADFLLVLTIVGAGVWIGLWFPLLMQQGNILGKYVKTQSDIYYKIVEANVAAWPEAEGTLCLSVIICLLLFITAAGAFRLRRYIPVCLPFLAVILLGMNYGRAPETGTVILELTGILGLLAEVQWEVKGGSRQCRQRNSPAQKGLRRSQIFLVILVTAAFVLGDVLVDRTADQIMARSEQTLKRQHQMEHQVKVSIEKMTWKLRKLFDRTDPGRLSNTTPKYEEKELLHLSLASKPVGTVYLRDYTGAFYQNGRWEETDTQKFQERFGEKHSLQVFGMFGNFVLETLMGESRDNLLNQLMDDEDIVDSRMKISYTENAKYLDRFSMPYGWSVAYQTGMTPEGMSLNGGDGWIGREEKAGSYELETYTMSTEAIAGILSKDNRRDTDPDYTGYVYEEYLEVPEGLDQLDAFADGIEDSDNMAKQVDLIRQAIWSQAEYSLDLNALPVGQDYLEYFLFSQQRGYCEHFATAGTILLRKKGIPARYVSGYSVGREEFGIDAAYYGEQYTAYAKDSDAHAWCEVYLKGLGWIPVEMTPGQINQKRYSAIVRLQDNMNKKNQGKKSKTTTKPKPVKTPSPSPKQLVSPVPEKQAASSVTGKFPAIMKPGIWIVAVGLLLGLLAVIAYKRICRGRLIQSMNREVQVNIRLQKRFGLLELYSRDCHLSRLAEYDEDSVYLRELNCYCGDVLTQTELRELTAIMEKAAFSPNRLSEKEGSLAEEGMKKLAGALYERCGLLRRQYVQRFCGWRKGKKHD